MSQVISTAPKILSKKSMLLSIDEKLTALIPTLMKSKFLDFLKLLTKDVKFEDKIFNYKTNNFTEFHMHTAKVRLYYRFKSPYNKLDYLSSYVFEDQNYITVLWRLKTLKSSLLTTYNPVFFLLKKNNLIKIEGALDFYVNNEGLIYKMINRCATVDDIKFAFEYSKLKNENEEDFEKRFENNVDDFSINNLKEKLKKTKIF